MNPKPRSSGPSVIVAGLLVALMAGWMGGCSKPDPTDVEVKKARAALSKRWAGYGEIPQSRSGSRDIAPVQQRRYRAQRELPRERSSSQF
jgi:hypothetical protein